MASTIEDRGMSQRTLDTEFRVYGKGVHTGQPVYMTVHPGEPDTGICFLRSDQPPSRALILARWSSVVRSQYSTDIGNAAGVSVRTVEHLMAALRLGGVDNALVVLNGPEIPALDGSAAPFLKEIERVGTVEQNAPARTIVLLHPVQVRAGNRYVRLTPSQNPRVTITIDYPGTALGMQSIGAAWNQDFLKREIAPARTFGFAAEHAGLMERGHALGADLTNTVVVDGGQIRNPGGLRYQDEFVRHKLLDAIGDLYLAGWPIRANYEGFKPGHGLHVELLRKVFEQDSDAWALVPARARKRVESGAAAALVQA
jgi:UDP-3-O-[3-hydroxymyristoyl] N-acetylglucosamine deacetylase